MGGHARRCAGPLPCRHRRARRTAARWHRGRHRHQRLDVVRAGRHRLAGRRDRAAAAGQRQPDGAAGRSGRVVRCLGRAARHRRGPHQDRQRHPAAGQRSGGGARRAAAAGAAGRVVDHARQGQPGAVRGGQPGRGARLRQRPHRRLQRVAGHPRAEHVPAGDGRRPLRVGHAARQRVPAVRASGASPASRPTRSAAGSTRRSRARWRPPSTRSSATPGPPSSSTAAWTSAGRSSTS